MHSTKGNILAITILILFGLSACQTGGNKNQEEDEILSQVYGKCLYESSIKDLIPSGTTTEDSTLMVNAYIEKWVRESLLMHEAEGNIPPDLNIDDLVRDYRSSLILHNYENYLIKEELDSTITQEELTSFYEQNKEQYQLKKPIIRCDFIKIPLSALDLETCTHLWNSAADADRESLMQYCNKNAEVYLLNEETWYEIDRITKQLPNGLVNLTNIALQKNLIHKDVNYQYYLRVLEIVTVNEPPPLSYIEDQAKKVILHQRKIKLLENKKEALYELEMKRNNIKIYTK